MPAKPSVCLLMMVRDEAAIIERCLLSVREHVDCWLIADTGSGDDTEARVRTMLDGLPGEYISLPWTDFATVRNELRDLSRGKADYVLWLDADETVEFTTETPWQDVQGDGFGIEVASERGSYLQWRLAGDDSKYCFSGPVAEVLIGQEKFSHLEGITIRHHEDGFRWRDPAKNRRDILLLEEALLSAVKNPLLVLALADCYAARGEWVEALYYYRKRASLDGQAAQTWYAQYQTAMMLDELGFDSMQVIAAYHKAYDFRPTKIEPLLRIAQRCRLEGKLQTGLDIILTALETEQVDRDYYFEPRSWEQDRLLEYLRINLALNCFTQVITTSEYVLANGQLPLKALKQVKVLYDRALEQHAAHPDLDQTAATLQPDQAPVVSPPGYSPGPIPEATEPRQRTKLCVGMCTFDDYDGVYFSVQAIRMYHPEVLDQIEILVIDNNPTGPGAAALKALDGAIDNYRYVPRFEAVSSFAKDYIFQEANADFVLVMDCHVFLEPGVLQQLLEYVNAHPDSNDLLQGPLVYDDLKSISTHFEPGWSGGMWGTWKTDERGENPQAEAFDIPMQGCGLFVCRHAAWPGFNPRFRGFGAEEGYIQEKIRQTGGRTLCLPFLRWMHRFNRPLGVPYPIIWKDRIRNYIIGWQELGLELESIRTHFSELLNEQDVEQVFEQVEQEMQAPLYAFDVIYYYPQPGQKLPGTEAEAGYLEQMNIANRVVRQEPVIETSEPSGQRLLTYRHIIGKLRQSRAESVLIIEQLPALENGLDKSPTEQVSALTSGACTHFCIHNENPDKAVVAVAIHRKIFDQLLESLPETPEAAMAWELKHGGLDKFLDGLT